MNLLLIVKRSPLVKFIDFSQIEGQILADIIEPLGIAPSKMIINVYRQIAKSGLSGIRGTRGTPLKMYKFKETDLVFDKSTCGSKLIIEDNEKVVHAPNSCGFKC